MVESASQGPNPRIPRPKGQISRGIVHFAHVLVLFSETPSHKILNGGTLGIFTARRGGNDRDLPPEFAGT